MATTSSPDRASIAIGAGISAGILGGILIDAFLALANHVSPIGIWQFVASAVVGPTAFTSPWFAVLGFVMHFGISIAWGIIYAALVLGPLRVFALRPVIGGILFGVAVMIVMTALVVAKHVAPASADAASLVKALIAHTAFFGLPVALYVSSAARRLGV